MRDIAGVGWDLGKREGIETRGDEWGKRHHIVRVGVSHGGWVCGERGRLLERQGEFKYAPHNMVGNVAGGGL